MARAARAEDVGPTPEFMTHHHVRQVDADEAGSRKHVVDDCNRLRLYQLGGWLTARQVAAGEALHRDWFDGRPVASVVGGYESPVDGGGWLPEGDEHAERRFREAMKAVGSSDARAVEHVALHGGCLFEWALLRGLPIDQAKVMLMRGLDALAEHYGL